MSLPDARYLILTSRLIPGLDGGFTVATLQRAGLLASMGAVPVLLSVDPGTPADHAQHRRDFALRGHEHAFRNLFDDAAGDLAWLRDASAPGRASDGVEYRTIPDADGSPLISLPVISGDPDWHLSTANVVVHAASGDRVLAGFGGLYRAWLDHVVADAASGPVVVVCESRQLGELLASWRPAGVRIVHTIHTTHLEPPYGVDAPVNGLWRRWFEVARAFDAVMWPTEQQRADVEARFGAHPGYTVVPNAAPDAVTAVAPVVGQRIVMLNRLAPGKRADHSIRAWSRVVEEVPDATLEIWGDGALRDTLQAQIDELGLGASVVLRGRSDVGPAVFDGATAMVQSTAFEGQGLATLEALSRGVPVVSYDVRYGPRDQIAAGGGILVPDGDVDALAAAMITVLTDAAARQRMSDAALVTARSYAPARVSAALADAVRLALR